MTHPDTLRVLTQLQEGDFATFEILFNTHWYELYRYAARVLGSTADAEDLTQELFCEVWENRQQLHIQSSFKAYLFGILRKKILRKFRDQGIQQRHLEQFRHLSDGISHTHDTDLADTMRIFLAEIEFLPAREKEVFLASQIQGLSVKEIAEQFSTSEQTVRNQIASALRKVEPVVKKLLS